MPGQILVSREALATDVRALVEAIVHTEVPDAELDALAAELAAATRALERRRRELPAIVVQAPDGRPFLATNPVDGLLNPLAPPLRACTDADGVYRGTVRFGGAHEGPPGRVHGGWSAMILDHALARACLSAGHTVMTVSLEVRYRGGTPSHADLEVEATVGGLEGHRRLATGVIRAGGVVTVEATARFAVPRAPAPAPSR